MPQAMPTRRKPRVQWRTEGELGVLVGTESEDMMRGREGCLVVDEGTEVRYGCLSVQTPVV